MKHIRIQLWLSVILLTFMAKPVLSIPATVEKWVGLNVCPSPATVVELPDNTDNGTTVRRELYDGCEDSTEVVLYVIEGGGHTWPGGSRTLQPEFLLGKLSFDIDASEVIWEFSKGIPWAM